MTPHHEAYTGQAVTRDQLISLLNTALGINEIRFARQAALSWLGVYPGDLQISLLYAKALMKASLPDQAVPILEHCCQSDPEHVEAVENLVQAKISLQYRYPSGRGQKYVPPELLNRIGWLLALGGSPIPARDAGVSHSLLRDKSMIAWSHALAKARHYLSQNDLDQAERQIHDALAAESFTPLVDAVNLKIMHSRMIASGNGSQMLRSLAAFFRQRWPDCVHFTLLLADALMDGSEPDQAVALLHEAAAHDVSGQVASRIWGDHHPYNSIWQANLAIDLDAPIPASVAAALGWNRLPEQIGLPYGAIHNPPGPETRISRSTEPLSQSGGALDGPERTDPPMPETLRSFQDELDKLGEKLHKPNLASSDGRFPIYVVMTTRQGIEKRYGSQTAAILEVEILRLVTAIQERRDWGGLLFYPDEGTYLFNTSKKIHLGRPPARANDPWAIKLALLDLDKALRHRGERIGAVLIVGGPDVVPFHNLPNPVDDADVEVASDNPYGTSDENYFIPEWPVGRLPDVAAKQDRNAQPLLYALSGLVTRHKSIAQHAASSPWYLRWLSMLWGWISRQSQNGSPGKPSFGITAAIWRQASLTVFRPIGEPRAMRISPPAEESQHGTNGGHSTPLPHARLGYFNLHGLVDAPEWYGQRDPGMGDASTGITDGDDYPIAVRPADVLNSGRAPQIVFSEACYGAHIINKNTEEALALKFLQVGTQALVGSTCISYGSISPPLIAGDFLGHAFWSYLREGLPAGEALRRAKIALAREMHTRQGYLDGEDQKTLISFILYGDPLAVPIGMEAAAKSVVRAARAPSNLKTVCDLSHQEDTPEPVPPEILSFVKGVVEQYLPGMQDARLTISLEHMDCDSCHPERQASTAIPRKTVRKESPAARQQFHLARKVITLSKDVPQPTHVHHHYARLTLDAQGKLVKLVVSR